MPRSFDPSLMSLDVVPVRCPRCGEAQNTLDGATDPGAAAARVGCMVCGYTFEPLEYRRLLDARLLELQRLAIGSA